jgi:hypothetical protein
LTYKAKSKPIEFDGIGELYLRDRIKSTYTARRITVEIRQFLAAPTVCGVTRKTLQFANEQGVRVAGWAIRPVVVVVVVGGGCFRQPPPELSR